MKKVSVHRVRCLESRPPPPCRGSKNTRAFHHYLTETCKMINILSGQTRFNLTAMEGTSSAERGHKNL